MWKTDVQFIRMRIDKLRRQLGVSERQMSREIGKNESYIQKIRSGASDFPVSELLVICEYLGVSVHDFFNAELENPKLRQNERKQAVLSGASKNNGE